MVESPVDLNNPGQKRTDCSNGQQLNLQCVRCCCCCCNDDCLPFLYLFIQTDLDEALRDAEIWVPFAKTTTMQQKSSKIWGSCQLLTWVDCLTSDYCFFIYPYTASVFQSPCQAYLLFIAGSGKSTITNVFIGETLYIFQGHILLRDEFEIFIMYIPPQGQCSFTTLLKCLSSVKYG